MDRSPSEIAGNWFGHVEQNHLVPKIALKPFLEGLLMALLYQNHYANQKGLIRVIPKFEFKSVNVNRCRRGSGFKEI